MQTEVLTVSGMACESCVGKVTRAVKAVSGVSDVDVSLAQGNATVKYDPKLTAPSQLRKAVEKAGYGVHSSQSARSRSSKGGCNCGAKSQVPGGARAV